MEQRFNPLLQLIQTGGPIVWLLIAMSVIAATVFFAKLLQFFSSGLYSLNRVDTALRQWRDGEQVQALSAVHDLGTKPLPDMVATAMHGKLQATVSEHEAREAAARVAADSLEPLKNGMRLLEFIATSAPLIGLLGTVIGMIEAFRALQAAGSRVDPSILSGGIWTALITTAAGLIVAIPTVLMLNILERRLERLHHKMQSATTQVFTATADKARESA